MALYKPMKIAGPLAPLMADPTPHGIKLAITSLCQLVEENRVNYDELLMEISHRIMAGEFENSDLIYFIYELFDRGSMNLDLYNFLARNLGIEINLSVVDTINLWILQNLSADEIVAKMFDRKDLTMVDIKIIIKKLVNRKHTNYIESFINRFLEEYSDIINKENIHEAIAELLVGKVREFLGNEMPNIWYTVINFGGGDIETMVFFSFSPFHLLEEKGKTGFTIKQYIEAQLSHYPEYNLKFEDCQFYVVNNDYNEYVIFNGQDIDELTKFEAGAPKKYLYIQIPNLVINIEELKKYWLHKSCYNF